MQPMNLVVSSTTALSLGLAALAQTAPPLPLSGVAPSPVTGLDYPNEFFPGATYDKAVPTPDSVLGFRLGDKAASAEQIKAVVEAIAAKSPRVKVFEYAKSHEGRPLHYIVVSSPETISKLGAVQADIARLADPRSVTAAEGDALAERLPLVAWMAYTIHGDEMSASDAAMSLLYHLAASTDAETTELLKNLVVIIDPLMNPDGKDRAVTLQAGRLSTQRRSLPVRCP